jgi:hypothetical protein
MLGAPLGVDDGTRLGEPLELGPVLGGSLGVALGKALQLPVDWVTVV